MQQALSLIKIKFLDMKLPNGFEQLSELEQRKKLMKRIEWLEKELAETKKHLSGLVLINPRYVDSERPDLELLRNK